MADNGQPPVDPAANFLAEEYKLLRGEVEARSQEQRAMERNVVLIATGVYSFLLAKDAPSSSDLAVVGWFIPPFVALLALGRWLDSLSIIKQLAQYMLNYELKMIPGHGAWEKSLSDSRKGNNLEFVSPTNICFWAFMAGAPMALAVRHTHPNLPALHLPSWTTPLASGLAAAAIALFIIHHRHLNDPANPPPSPQTPSPQPPPPQSSP